MLKIYKSFCDNCGGNTVFDVCVCTCVFSWFTSVLSFTLWLCVLCTHVASCVCVYVCTNTPEWVSCVLVLVSHDYERIYDNRSCVASLIGLLCACVRGKMKWKLRMHEDQRSELTECWRNFLFISIYLLHLCSLLVCTSYLLLASPAFCRFCVHTYLHTHTLAINSREFNHDISSWFVVCILFCVCDFSNL